MKFLNPTSLKTEELVNSPTPLPLGSVTILDLIFSFLDFKFGEKGVNIEVCMSTRMLN